MRKIHIILLLLSLLKTGTIYPQTLQVALSPDKSKVDRSTNNGTATIFFDSPIEDLNIICTDENPNEPIVKVTDNLWFMHIDVKKDIAAEGVCYRNFLLKSASSAEYYLTTDPIIPNQVLYYTISLPNELEPKYLEERSKNLASSAMTLVNEGDSYLAQILSCRALPPNLPYTLDAEFSLRKSSYYNTAFLRGHSGKVNNMAFNPANSIIASASNDSTIRLWDINSGRCIRVLGGHSDIVNCVCFSPNGSLIASGSLDRHKLVSV